MISSAYQPVPAQKDQMPPTPSRPTPQRYNLSLPRKGK